MAIVLATLIITTTASSTYITTPPPTVYEDPSISPQNMDYDRTNNMFIAHPGWLNDKLIHYYKFRMYTPATYPTKVAMQDPPTIPIAPLYLVTTSANDFTKLVPEQKPIIRYHTADGEDYSDFVQINWIIVDPTYQANTYRSYEDITQNVPATNIIPSNIYANLPVVPIGSRLQDPIALGTTAAPIKPLIVWYKGVEVQTFLFETTSQQLADHYNSETREGSAAAPGSGYEISVASFVQDAQVINVPIFHLNQYPMGVTTGQNHGGPWKGGGKNIISLDRGDTGYSPLWRVMWISRVPIDYTADQASNQAQLTTANGFQVIGTPMYVNCPNVGPHGGSTTNPNKASTFTQYVSPSETFTLAGSLVMEGDKTVKAYLGDKELGTAQTNMMGAYILRLSADQLPEGQSTIIIKDASGSQLNDATVTKNSNIFGILPVVPTIAGIIVAIVAASGLLLSRRNRKSAKTPNTPASKP